MADIKIAVTPAAPVPAAAPAAPAVSTPAPALAAPSAVAKAAAAAPEIKKSSLLAPEGPRKRESLSAKKALGEEAASKKDVAAVIKAERKKNPAVELPAEPPGPASSPAVARVEAAPATLPVPELSGAAITPEPAAPAKIKVGGKEYTTEELEAELAKGVPAPVVAAAAEDSRAPAASAPAPTAEEIKQREEAFVTAVSAQLETPLTEAEMDTILAGGPEAVGAFNNIRKRDMATAILQARKQLADGFNPILKNLHDSLGPLLQQHRELTQYGAEQEFRTAHPEFVPHEATVRRVADELYRRYPAEVSKLTRTQFLDEVARQTDDILSAEHRRWFPQGNGNWRVGAVIPAPVVAAAVEAAVPPVAATTPMAMASAAPRLVRAPAANAPAAATPGGAPQWGKAVAKSMRG